MIEIARFENSFDDTQKTKDGLKNRDGPKDDLKDRDGPKDGLKDRDGTKERDVPKDGGEGIYYFLGGIGHVLRGIYHVFKDENPYVLVETNCYYISEDESVMHLNFKTGITRLLHSSNNKPVYLTTTGYGYKDPLLGARCYKDYGSSTVYFLDDWNITANNYIITHKQKYFLTKPDLVRHHVKPNSVCLAVHSRYLYYIKSNTNIKTPNETLIIDQLLEVSYVVPNMGQNLTVLGNHVYGIYQGQFQKWTLQKWTLQGKLLQTKKVGDCRLINNGNSLYLYKPSKLYQVDTSKFKGATRNTEQSTAKLLC